MIETKATLGGTKTPGFDKTQGTGAGKVADFQAKIALDSGGWSKAKMLEVDPNVQDKLNAFEDAVSLGKIKYLHAQVFFDSQ